MGAPAQKNITSRTNTNHRTSSSSSRLPASQSQAETRPQQSAVSGLCFCIITFIYLVPQSRLESDTSPELSPIDGTMEPLPVRNVRHARSLSETRPSFSRSEVTRLSSVQENESATLEVESMSSPTARSHQRTRTFNSRQWQVDDLLPPSGVQEEISDQTVPSSRAGPSLSRSIRLEPSYREDSPETRSMMTPVEEGIVGERAASPPSYSYMSSVFGSIRRK